MVRSSCLCGDVAYEAGPDFSSMSHCHCEMCRKIHGTAFATYLRVPVDQFQWIQGQDKVTTYESSPGFYRGFCPRCGSVAPSPDRMSGEFTFIPAGNLEADCGIRPQRHIFVESRAPWYEITDDIEQFGEYQPGADSPTVERESRAQPGGPVRGSCLCNEVGFEYDGDPRFVMNCHCSRCRRVRSAAHGTNVFVSLDHFRWTRGESAVRNYRVPEAKYFGHAFCQTCGSSVARVSAERRVAVIPAGSLDDNHGMAPRGHIFVGSKAPWFEISDDLPQFEEAPPAK